MVLDAALGNLELVLGKFWGRIFLGESWEDLGDWEFGGLVTGSWDWGLGTDLEGQS